MQVHITGAPTSTLKHHQRSEDSVCWLRQIHVGVAVPVHDGSETRYNHDGDVPDVNAGDSKCPIVVNAIRYKV